MQIFQSSTRLVAAAAFAGLALFGACSSTSSIDEAELESKVASQLAETTGQEEPNVDCPSDLDAEVDATIECELTVDGEDAVYPVTVTVTELDGDVANFDIEVGEAE